VVNTPLPKSPPIDASFHLGSMGLLAYTTVLKKSGESVEMISELLGHKDIKQPRYIWGSLMIQLRMLLMGMFIKDWLINLLHQVYCKVNWYYYRITRGGRIYPKNVCQP